MKKSKKIGLCGILLVLGASALSSCTASFCSIKDKARMLYAFDYGVTSYYDVDEKPENAEKLDGFNNIYYTASFENNKLISDIINSASKNGIRTPTITYFATLDKVVLSNAIYYYNKEAQAINGKIIDATATAKDIAGEDGVLDKFGYVKFYDNVSEKKLQNWANWNEYNEIVRSQISPDEYPDQDFLKFYQATMKQKIASYTSCIATTEGEYGYYGYGSNKTPITIEAKSWGYAWKKGFLEGLLIYPIGWCIDSITAGFAGCGLNVQKGVPQILAILFVTLIIRLIMLGVTFKQTQATSKMNELQPEMAKIQAKYPNANTNQREKELMAMDMQKLYKKNKINPFSSILVMIFQFPVFICVWGAMSGSSYLATGEFLGLRLSDSISSVLFNGYNWSHGTPALWTALVLFILMAGSQIVSMLLPQWIQKKKQKNISKLGRNPAQTDQNKKMKWFTYIMMVVMILMGFSLASAMGIYWFIGALISIGQTLIMQSVSSKKKKEKKY